MSEELTAQQKEEIYNLIYKVEESFKQNKPEIQHSIEVCDFITLLLERFVDNNFVIRNFYRTASPTGELCEFMLINKCTCTNSISLLLKTDKIISFHVKRELFTKMATEFYKDIIKCINSESHKLVVKTSEKELSWEKEFKIEAFVYEKKSFIF